MIDLAAVTADEPIPPSLADDWFMERENTGGRIWIEGSEEQAARAEVEITDPWPTGRWRAPYGDFFAASAGQPPGPPAEPRWEKPTPEFLAALPRDPAPLLDRLQASGPPDSPGDRRAFRHTADLLRSGLIAADLRLALYEARCSRSPASSSSNRARRWSRLRVPGHGRSRGRTPSRSVSTTDLAGTRSSSTAATAFSPGSAASSPRTWPASGRAP
jgi:hypothetical protein